MGRNRESVGAQMDHALDQGYGWCRALSHQWRPPRDTGNGALFVSKGTVTIEFKCANGCKMTRKDTISIRTGELVSREYHGPNDYVMKVPVDEVRPNRADWRKAHYSNLLGGR